MKTRLRRSIFSAVVVAVLLAAPLPAATRDDREPGFFGKFFAKVQRIVKALQDLPMPPKP